jgi:exonuclease SbcC
MINEISIQNFQSHKQTHIVFKKGLNVITGSSDSGKSSVIRALLWVVNNRPSGDSIRNWNSSSKDGVTVNLVADNFSIEKKRLNGKSSYSYKNEEGDSIYYEAIKTDVPEEIVKNLDLSEFNIQTQHQPYFLLNDSGGEIAKKLNDLVGLSVIDNLFKNINSSITSISRELQVIELDIKEKEEAIKSTEYLEEISKEIARLDISVKEHKELQESFLEIDSALERYFAIYDESESLEVFIDSEERVNQLKELLNEYVALSDKEEELKENLDDVFEAQSDRNKYAKQLLQLESEYKNTIKDNPVCPILKTVCKELESYGK